MPQPPKQFGLQAWPSCLVNFVFLIEMGLHPVGQPGVKLLTSSDLPASTSQSARITSLSHRAQPMWHSLVLKLLIPILILLKTKEYLTQLI